MATEQLPHWARCDVLRTAVLSVLGNENKENFLKRNAVKRRENIFVKQDFWLLGELTRHDTLTPSQGGLQEHGHKRNQPSDH